MTGIKIIGTGSYVPELTVKNEDFMALVDTSDEWIRTRTGMERRHISVDEPIWYMGTQAARRAMENAGVTAAEIDMMIVTTVTPDFNFPSCSCCIQRELGINSVPAMDINVACAGLSYSLDIARRYLMDDDVRNVLLIGAERLSQVTDYEDRGTCVLLGDAAGALVVTKADTPFGAYLSSESKGLHHIYSVRPRRDIPFGPPDAVDHDLLHPIKLNTMYMNGREVYKFATQMMPHAVRQACEKINLKPEDLDLLVPHQANLRIIETAVKNLKLPMEKVFVNIQDYGNTSSATIMVALDECARSGRMKRGDRVCIVGFGAGLCLGANVFTY